MTKIFRKLHNKRNWDRDEKLWLGADDVPADTTKCLRTGENILSVYLLNEPSDHMIDRVVAALALTRDKIENLDLVIAPVEVISTSGIEQCKIQGKTPDSEVNKWHLDLVELTVNKIANLALAIKDKGVFKRYYHADVEKVIQNSLSNDCIAIGNINKKLKVSLEENGYVFPTLS